MYPSSQHSPWTSTLAIWFQCLCSQPLHSIMLELGRTRCIQEAEKQVLCPVQAVFVHGSMVLSLIIRGEVHYHSVAASYNSSFGYSIVIESEFLPMELKICILIRLPGDSEAIKLEKHRFTATSSSKNLLPLIVLP